MNDLLIRNESIQLLFNWYCGGKFWVNRKYQRKLVWSLNEKKSFINSIAKSYPVPLFLLAKVSEAQNNYEIIDGMQRLESIFSFLRGEYSISINDEEGYFDLCTMAESKALLDNGEIAQKHPILNRKVCVDIANYQLPLSITTFQDNEIEEIFRRINATGRQLSSQDLRQAGATGVFSDLVRKLSTQIRRDTSPDDILALSKMREISLSSNDLPYGIDLKNVFWVKNQIVTISNMRLSRDEELISYLLIYILLGPTVSPTAKNLDIIYGFNDDDPDLLTNKVIMEIEKQGDKKIVSMFMYVFDELERILASSGKNFSHLIFSNDAVGKGRSFQVIFLALYNLFTSGKVIKNINGLISTLDGIGNREFSDISSDKWKAKYRDEKIKAIEGVIKNHFEDADSQDPAVDNWISKLENLLSQSKIEQQLFDFKIGLHSLQNEELNEKCLSKIVKTLTAMANTGKNTTGYVIVGVADKKNDAILHTNTYSKDYIQFNNFYITGVDGEIEEKYKSADIYFNLIKQKIEKEPVDEYVISYITRYMRLVNYYDKSILVFTLKSTDKPLLYDNKFYERRAANIAKVFDTTEISLGDMIDLFARFK